jgi:DNA-binding NarL/FixJ family response regulator
MNAITIVLADDHEVVRLGLRALLEKEPDFRIVGEAADGLQTVNFVKQLNPNVLVLDLMMPGINGIEVTWQVKKHSPLTHVIILSMYSNEAYVVETLRKGAEGYVLKDSTGSDLIKAVREVTAGRRYLSPPFSERAIDIYIQTTKTTALDLYETLTPREREVLQMAAQGYTNVEIADRLSISPRTVEVHRSNMMTKLGLHNQAGLIRYAMQRGILPLENKIL